MIGGLRADGVFGESETKHLRRAYGLALSALELTHAVKEETKTLLADCLLREMMTYEGPDIDVCLLATKSIDRFVVLNDCLSDYRSLAIH